MVGFANACGVRDGGALACWGENYSGNLGDDDAWYETPIPTVF